MLLDRNNYLVFSYCSTSIHRISPLWSPARYDLGFNVLDETYFPESDKWYYGDVFITYEQWLEIGRYLTSEDTDKHILEQQDGWRVLHVLRSPELASVTITEEVYIDEEGEWNSQSFTVSICQYIEMTMFLLMLGVDREQNIQHDMLRAG